MGKSVKQVMHTPISHSCFGAGMGQDIAAQHPCTFTAATGSGTARGDLLWQRMLLPSLLQGASLNFTQAGYRAGKIKFYFWLPLLSLYIIPSVTQEGPRSFTKSFQLKTRAPGSSSETSDLCQGHWGESVFVSQIKCDLNAGTLEAHPCPAIPSVPFSRD